MKKIMVMLGIIAVFAACGKNKDEQPTVVACPNYQSQSYCCVQYSNGYCGYVTGKNGDYWNLSINGYNYTFHRNILSCY